MAAKQYQLLGANGGIVLSETPGTLGGYRRGKIYGRLDCPSALRHLARGHYAAHRVFFATEEDALRNGYRPCGVCLREKYRGWKQKRAAAATPDATTASTTSDGDPGESHPLRPL